MFKPKALFLAAIIGSISVQSIAQVNALDMVVESQKRIANVVRRQVDTAAEVAQTEVDKKTTGQPLNDALFKLYQVTEAHCNSQLNVLKAKLERFKQSQVRVGASGKIVTLLGAVTAHPAGKTILTGIGITGSDNNSVLGLFADYSAEEVASLKTQITSVTTEFTAQITAYEAIRPDADTSGVARKNALFRAKAVCDGLVAPSAPTPDPPAADPK